MRRSVSLAVVALLVAASASAQSRGDLPPRTNEVVRLVRATVVPAVVISTSAPDYPGIVLAILDRCVRAHAGDSPGFAGRALILVTASERAAFVSVAEADESLAALTSVCLAEAAALPPLPPLYRTTRVLPRGELRLFLEIDVDARGLPRDEPPSSRTPVDRAFDVTLDTRSIELERSTDVETARVVRDDLITSLDPRLDEVVACLENDRRRGAYRGGDLATRLRIDARGVVRESRVDASLAIDGCVHRAFVGTTFPRWRSHEDVVVRFVLRAR